MRVLSDRGRPTQVRTGGDLDVHLLEALPVAAYTCDADGLITYYNQLAVKAWGREPKLNDPSDRYCGSFRMFTRDGTWVPHDQCWMALCLRDGKKYDGEEIVVERPDGSRLTVEVHATPYFDDQGALIGAVNIVVDITDRKRAEEAIVALKDQLTVDLAATQRAENALSEANQRKDEFLATLAHELRNPLASIRNAVELLRIKNPSDPELRDARDIIDRQVHQMTRLVDDLLDVSRLTSGKVTLQKARVSLEAVVTDAVESSRPFIEESDHNLSVTLPPTPIYMEGDAARLVQVFSNLLTNAAKYTERGGRIWLTAELCGGEVVVSVGDTGIGIDPGHLPQVFEMFSQVAPALKRSQGGIGIGLSLVRGLVELHKGSVEARSGGIGMGSEFVVRLPVSETAEQVAHKPNGNGEKSHLPPNCRILVVDDNRDSAQSLAVLLRAMGYDTRTSYDGLEAIQAAATFQPDVVLLDIWLPKMDGYEVARQIRRRQWGRNIFLTALTGWGQEEDKRRSKVAGFDHHLTKPVNLDALMELLSARSQVPKSQRRAS